MSMLTFTLYALLAVLLGGLIGWQREHIGKASGFRTFALVTLGSTIFTLLSINVYGTSAPHIPSQILIGIGFIGAGMIIHKHQNIEGLTTAACLWATSAIGMGLGLGWVLESVIATVVILLILLFPEKKMLP